MAEGSGVVAKAFGELARVKHTFEKRSRNCDVLPTPWLAYNSRIERKGTGSNDVGVASSDSIIGDTVLLWDRSGVRSRSSLQSHFSPGKGSTAIRHWCWRNRRCSARRVETAKKPAKRTIPT